MTYSSYIVSCSLTTAFYDSQPISNTTGLCCHCSKVTFLPAVLHVKTFNWLEKTYSTLYFTIG